MMGRQWLSVAGRLGVACGAGAFIGLAQGNPNIAVTFVVLWIGMAIGVLMTLVVQRSGG